MSRLPGDVAATAPPPRNLPHSRILPLSRLSPLPPPAAALHLPRPRPQPASARYFHGDPLPLPSIFPIPDPDPSRPPAPCSKLPKTQNLPPSCPPASRLSRPPLSAHYFPLPLALSPPASPSRHCLLSIFPVPDPSRPAHQISPCISLPPSPSLVSVSVCRCRLPSRHLSLPPLPLPPAASVSPLPPRPRPQPLPSSRAFQCVLSVDDAGPAQRHLSPPPAAFPLPPSLFPLPPARCPPARASPFLFSMDDASCPRDISLANARCADVISSTNAQRP